MIGVHAPKLYAIAALTLVAVAPPRAGSCGVTVALPPGWHSTKPSQGRVTNPLTRLVISSGPIATRLTGTCHTQIADYTFPKTAAAIVVVEWTKPIAGTARGTEPPLPRPITAAKLPLRPHNIECFAGRGGSIEFSARGHTFAAYVLLGTKAPPRLANVARAVLDTLRISTR